MSRKKPEELRSPPLVRRARPAGVRAPVADQADGLRSGGLCRQAGDRDRQHLVRHQPLPRPLQGAGRGHQAWHLPGGRLPARAAGDVAERAVRQADDDALPQLPCHGDRGAAAQPSGRRCGADGRLRQDHARPDHGRDLDGPARDLHAGGCHAARQLSWRGAGLGLGFLEVLGRAAGRQHHHAGLGRDRGRHRPLCRHVHDHGHGRDHDGDRRGDGLLPAGRVLDPRTGRRPPAHVRRFRATRRRDGLGRPETLRHHVGGLCRQRDPLPPRHGRLDQCHDPRRRHGTPGWYPTGPAALRRAGAANSGARQRPPVGQVSDGGLLLRGRHPCPAGRAQG